MIAKHIPMKALGKSDFAALAEYITDSQSKTERLGLVELTNCQSATVDAAIEEILATQQMNTRAKGDKTYHLLVSFRAGEKPDNAVLEAIESRVCEGLGFGEHQRISAVHHDTDNLHIHIAINKIHPIKLTMHEPYYSHRTLADVCAALEQEHGLEVDNHEPLKRGAESRASDMENHAGIESLITWIKRECLDDIKEAKTWEELNLVLQENGLELKERGRGFVVESDNGTFVKASTLSRDLSKSALEKKYGDFERQVKTSLVNRKKKPKRSYKKDPIYMRVDTAELYIKYKAGQESLTEDRAKSLSLARTSRNAAIDLAMKSGKLRRSMIKLVDSKGIDKRILYSQANKALKKKIASIHAEFNKDRLALYSSHQRMAWADWLKHEAMNGNDEALNALRARQAAQGLKGDVLAGGGGNVAGNGGHTLKQDNITKKGTVILRNAKAAIRDDGDKLQLSRGVDKVGMEEALRVAVSKFGERIAVNGTVQFKALAVKTAAESGLQIVFEDQALESRRLDLINKEVENGRGSSSNGRQQNGRGLVRRGDGAIDGRGLANGNSTRPGEGSKTGSRAWEQGGGHKPNIVGVGGKAPAQRRNGLRNLSKLGMVRIGSGSEVLLPGDVSSNLVNKGATNDNRLRWPAFGAGLTGDQKNAAEKYISEREGKRAKGFDILKHSPYSDIKDTIFFEGVRHVDGNALALLKAGDEILVLPVDKATAQRLTKTKVGDIVSVTARGSIRTKGKSR